MKVLVLWAEPHSANMGVRVLSAGATALIRAVAPDAEISFQGNGAGDAPVRIGNPRGVLKQVATRDRRLVDWLAGFDLVLDTRAGDSFADIYGLRRLTAMSLIGELTHRAGVPLVLAPQTVGPFNTRRGRLLGSRSLRQARLVMARDPISAGYAAGIGRSDCVLTTDVVFALDVPVVERSRDVVFNVSGLLWLPNRHVDSVSYQDTVRSSIKALQHRGRSVALLPHVLNSPVADNDEPVAQALGAELGLEVLKPDSLGEIREIMASAQVVIGSRMHACLNALSVGTPAIPLAYSRKFLPLLDDLGWYRTIDLREPGAGAALLTAVDDPDLSSGLVALRRRATELMKPAVDALGSLL